MLARTDGNWVRCGRCGHKLFQYIGDLEITGPMRPPTISIKCHSCKEINYFMLGGRGRKNGTDKD